MQTTVSVIVCAMPADASIVPNTSAILNPRPCSLPQLLLPYKRVYQPNSTLSPVLTLRLIRVWHARVKVLGHNLWQWAQLEPHHLRAREWCARVWLSKACNRGR